MVINSKAWSEKKRKLRKALFNTLSKPLIEYREKSKRRKVWLG